MRPASRYRSGCSRTRLTTVKIAVVAPIPSANAATTTAVNVRLRASILTACRASLTTSDKMILSQRPIV